MSGLFNPFADEDNKEEQPSFSFYSDPLAAYTPGGGRGRGRSGAPGPRPSGPPPASGPGAPSAGPPPGGQGGYGPMHGGRYGPMQGRGGQWGGPPPSGPPGGYGQLGPRPPPGPPPPGMYPGGVLPPPQQPWQHQPTWQQQGHPQGQPQGQQGGFRGPAGAHIPKMQRTGDDTRFNQGGGGGRGWGGRGHEGGGAQHAGRGRAGRGGRGGHGGNDASGGEGGGNMARFYKPSFSQDPWHQLERKAQQLNNAGGGAMPTGNGQAGGSHAVRSLKPVGGVSLADVLASSLQDAQTMDDTAGAEDRPWH